MCAALWRRYEFDGIFNDMGYDRRDGDGNVYGMEDYDPYIEDLLVRMYSMIKNEYGGIVKLHIGEIQLPVTNEKIYDYLWVGRELQNLRGAFKDGKLQPVCYTVPGL